MYADEDEILEFDIVGAIANSPSRVRFLFHGQGLAVLHESLHTLGHILCQLGKSYGLRWAAEILCRDLPAPLPVSGPLESEVESAVID